MLRRLAILGSTGSIGRQTLEVLRSLEGYRVSALAAGRNWQLLAEQARQFRPDFIAIADDSVADDLRRSVGEDVTVLSGLTAMTDLITRSRCDMLLSGVVGATGLAPTLAAIDAGADLAIANKETLVMAGEIVMPAARAKGVAVLPVDSEHSAIHQCLAGGRREEVRRVVITASGGALRDWDDAAVERAAVVDALNHPTWRMGRKITIDSATLMNKALEVVEAHWLFDLPAEQIDVVLHPESIVHSFVEFCDGSVIAQLARPDMTMPIAYALSHPRRAPRDVPSLDLASLGRLTFAPLPPRCRRAVELGYEVIRRGGLAGAALNGANEAAAEAFLAGSIRFGEIVPMAEDILRQAPEGRATLDSLLSADAWARAQVAKRIAEPTPHAGV
jgi:1-deoxy-D-xylulose-5-phosphate reductoisomerase